MLCLFVPLMLRQVKVPPILVRYFFNSGCSSSSFDICASFLSIPLIFVTVIFWPTSLGHQVISVKCCFTSFSVDPYILIKNASFLTLPGSKFLAGGDFNLPVIYC